MNYERLSDHVFDPEARIERGEGILKNNLQIPAHSSHFPAASRQQVAALESHLARSRLDQSKDQASECALARTGFSHEAQRFSGVNVERDVVDCAYFSRCFASKRRLPVGKDLRQVADFKQRHRLSFNDELLHSFDHQTQTLLTRYIGQQVSR